AGVAAACVRVWLRRQRGFLTDRDEDGRFHFRARGLHQRRENEAEERIATARARLEDVRLLAHNVAEALRVARVRGLDPLEHLFDFPLGDRADRPAAFLRLWLAFCGRLLLLLGCLLLGWFGGGSGLLRWFCGCAWLGRVRFANRFAHLLTLQSDSLRCRTRDPSPLAAPLNPLRLRGPRGGVSATTLRSHRRRRRAVSLQGRWLHAASVRHGPARVYRLALGAPLTAARGALLSQERARIVERVAARNKRG